MFSKPKVKIKKFRSSDSSRIASEESVLSKVEAYRLAKGYKYARILFKNYSTSIMDTYIYKITAAFSNSAFDVLDPKDELVRAIIVESQSFRAHLLTHPNANIRSLTERVLGEDMFSK